MGINIGDILFTLIYFVFLISIIYLIVRFFSRGTRTKKQIQIINQKLDIILEKIEDKEQAK